MKREVKIKNVAIGGKNKIAIQSMTDTKTHDTVATLDEIIELYQAGCDLVRVSVPDQKSLDAVSEIVKNSPIPVIGDFHYSLKLALKSVEKGIAKVRINPSNIGKKEELIDLIRACKDYGVPVRIGVNSGSVHDDYKHLPMSDALAQSAFDYEKLFLDNGFNDIVLSVKSSDVVTTINAYEKLDKLSNSPLHLGVTEAGTLENGIIKSAIGIGSLLQRGIGDTIRVSLTTNHLVDEVRVAKKILNFLDLREDMPNIVCCPTCARTCVDVKKLAELVESATKNVNKKIKISVMGCVVNGIGESLDADLAIAGGVDKSVILSKGKILEIVDNDKLIIAFEKHLNEIICR